MLCVFVALKIPHLSHPYYWDESWPYATAIKALHDHGISLMPNAIDPEISRGHPLFFHALGAAWMKVFGPSHVSMHSFALVISLLFLWLVYEAGLRLFNMRVAVMALVLVASQELFFVQSSMVLLEMLVALLGFAAMYYYVRARYVLASLCLAMLFYTKESGLIVGFVLGIDALTGLWRGREHRKDTIARILCVGIPTVLAGVFFLLNKLLHGWYIFPFYASIMERRWDVLWYRFHIGCVSDELYTSYKYIYYLLLAILATITAIRYRKWRYLSILLLVVLVFYMVNDMRTGRLMPSVPFFIVFSASWGFVVWQYAHRSVFAQMQQRRMLVLTGGLVFCFMLYSTFNYYTYRYMLLSIIPMLFIAAALFDHFAGMLHRSVYYLCFVVFGITSYVAYSTNEGFGDDDLGAYDGMDVQQHVVDVLEKGGYYDSNVGTASFVSRQHLLDPATGYLGGQRTFRTVRWDIDERTDIAVFTNIEPDGRREVIMKDPAYELMDRYEKGRVWSEIYRRRR
ncbi:hypothetical protein GCM10023093_24910 [Nemorincola caseinilytica]|uniref:Glycosyltransferase RgtA/B/C/D-like domain-containing protein n=1 Tax=Nemorincola caseinilytica TaxID=2054315 RepID=A0ABP8NJL5_9BACT